jgi:AraC-like DNA-binding protein
MTYEALVVVRSALALMRVTPARPLMAVAAQCGVSRHTLGRAFRRWGPASAADVRDLLLHERMEALMTASPPKTIKEISDGLGFTTPQSFARWAKREGGLVPRALREELCRRLNTEAVAERGVEAAAAPLHDAGPGTPLAGGGHAVCLARSREDPVAPRRRGRWQMIVPHAPGGARHG